MARLGRRNGRPASRAWHTLFDAVLKAGDRFDFFLLDEALKAYGEELFPDPQERLEWCIRTAIGLERWDEAKRLINVLDGYALPPSGSTDRLPEDFSSPVRRLRAEWAYARAAAGMEDDILVPTLVDELFALGETQKSEHLIARAWPAVFSALLSFLQPEENTGKGSGAPGDCPMAPNHTACRPKLHLDAAMQQCIEFSSALMACRGVSLFLPR